MRTQSPWAAGALLIAVLTMMPAPAQASETCIESGDPFRVTKSKTPELAKGDIVYKVSKGYCKGTTFYKRRDVRAVASNDNIPSIKCNTQVAGSKAYGGGAARGNGCN